MFAPWVKIRLPSPTGFEPIRPWASGYGFIVHWFLTPSSLISLHFTFSRVSGFSGRRLVGTVSAYPLPVPPFALRSQWTTSLSFHFGSCLRCWFLSSLLVLVFVVDSLRGSSDKIGTIQRRLVWPLRKDDTHKSRFCVVSCFGPFSEWHIRCHHACNSHCWLRSHCSLFFFSVQRRVASARSFNMFQSMLHMGSIN